MTTETRRLYRSTDTDVSYVTPSGQKVQVSNVTGVRNASVTVSLSRDSVGGGNPWYKDLIKHHMEATNPVAGNIQLIESKGKGTWQADWVEKDSPGLGYTRTSKKRGKGYLPVASSFTAPQPQSLTDAREDAKKKALDRISEFNRTFNGLQFMGELREAIHMIRRPGDGLVKYILGEQFLSTQEKLKRAKLRNRRPLKGNALKRSLQQAASDSWLEGSFGWRPFLSDIRAGAEAAARFATDPPIVYKRFRVSGRGFSDRSSVTRAGGSIDGVLYDIESYTLSKANAIIYGELKHRGGLSCSKQGLAKLGLSWGNFIPTVWELLPYSFLVDYFSNVGDVLDSSFVDLSTLVRASTGYRHEGRSVRKLSNFRPQALVGVGNVISSTASGSHPDIVFINRLVARQKGADLSPLKLRFKFPPVGLKWVNMGALIAGQYKGLARRILL